MVEEPQPDKKVSKFDTCKENGSTLKIQEADSQLEKIDKERSFRKAVEILRKN